MLSTLAWTKSECRSLGASSDIVKVNLPRPMGLVFEENKAKGQVVVADFVQGSQAEKLSKVSFPCPALPARRVQITQLMHTLECYICTVAGLVGCQLSTMTLLHLES